jgi:hypothetical protein
MSSQSFNTITTANLARGLNFTVTPRHLPTDDNICRVEASITQKERAALRELQNNKVIYTLAADKGNVTVILDFSDYSYKIHALLTDPTYEPLNCNHVTQAEKQTNSLLYQLKHRNSLF